MCTTQMLIEGGVGPFAADTQGNDAAWLNPAPVGPTRSDNNFPQNFTDFSGFLGARGANSCFGWGSNSAGNNGTVITRRSTVGGGAGKCLFFLRSL